MRFALAVLALALASLLASIWLAREGAGPVLAGNVAQVQDSGPDHAEQALAEPVVGSLRQELAGPAEIEAPPLTQLFGTLILVRRDGTQDARSSGEAKFALYGSSVTATGTAQVVDGRWSWSCADGDGRVLQLVSYRCNGERTAVLGQPAILLGSGPIELRAQVMPTISLRVLSASSGSDLDRVTVVEGVHYQHPASTFHGVGGRHAVVSGAPSPLSLPATKQEWSEERTLWIVAPDHAWQYLTLDADSDPDQVVVLEEGGELQIELSGEPPAADVVFRLYSAHRLEPIVQLVQERGTALQAQGIAAGNYSLRAERGEWFIDPARLAETTVLIEAGGSARASLHLSKRDPIPRIEAQIQVSYQPGWDLSNGVRLRIHPLGETRSADPNRLRLSLTPDPTNPKAYTFRGSVQDLSAGRFMLLVMPSDYRQLINLPAGQRGDIRIDVPGPGDVVVRLADTTNGSPLRSYLVHWRNQNSPEYCFLSTTSARFTAGDIRFRAPLGELFLEADIPWNYTEVPGQTWFVEPGSNLFSIQATPATGLRIVLQHNSTSEPVLEYGGLSLEPIGHQGEQGRHTDIWSHVTQPGRYKLSLSPIPGFGAIPDRMVDIAAGEMLDVTIPLTHKGN